jgi:hypothetical protein
MMLIIMAFHMFREGTLQVRQVQLFIIGSGSSKQLLYAVSLCWTNMPDLSVSSLATVFEYRSTTPLRTHSDQSNQLICYKPIC